FRFTPILYLPIISQLSNISTYFNVLKSFVYQKIKMGIYRVSVKKQEVAFMSDHGFSDKAKSAVNKVKGEAKDQWGNATNDSKKETEGKMDKAKAKVQHKKNKAKEEEKEQWENTTNDSKKETERKMDKAKGKVQEKTGKAKEYLNEEDEKSR